MSGRKSKRDELLVRWLRLRLRQEQDSGVLLVFPDSPRRARLEEALKEVGLRPTSVSRAADALELLESDAAQTTRPFDLLILFSKLSDLPGIELAEFVRTRPYDPEIILVTSSPQSREARKAVQCRVAAYLGPEDSDPEVLAARARVLWEAGLARRVRRLIIRDLKSLMETAPNVAATIVPQVDALVARHREARHAKARVLVADPDGSVRQGLVEALEALGLGADSALGATTALHLLGQDSYDVLLVDPMSANVAPAAFLEKVRQAAPNLDLVVLTRKATLQEALDALKEGVADLVVIGPNTDFRLAAQRVASLVERRYRLEAEELIVRSLYEVLTAQLLSAPSGLPERAFRGMARMEAASPVARKRLQTLELTSGDYEVLSAGGEAPDARDVPDADVIRFIDEVLAAGGTDIQSTSDKRTVHRVPAAIPVLFRAVGGHETRLGFSEDLSLGGLSVGAEDVPQAGQELELVLYLPKGLGLRPVRCQGRVAWSSGRDAAAGGQPTGFGVQFTVLGPEASEAVRQFVVGAGGTKEDT